LLPERGAFPLLGIKLGLRFDHLFSIDDVLPYSYFTLEIFLLPFDEIL